MDLYARTGIAEYLLIDLPLERNGWRYELRGLRLSLQRRYQPIPPDDRGRILSQTTGLLFGVAADGRQIDIFDAATGERLLTPREQEQKLRAEAEALAAAESEVARLRAEIERLKKG